MSNQSQEFPLLIYKVMVQAMPAKGMSADVISIPCRESKNSYTTISRRRIMKSDLMKSQVLVDRGGYIIYSLVDSEDLVQACIEKLSDQIRSYATKSLELAKKVQEATEGEVKVFRMTWDEIR